MPALAPTSCRRLSARHVPMKSVLPAAATKEAIRVAQNLLANERIGIRTHHNGSRLITWSPTDHIGPRCIPGHDRDSAAVGLVAIRRLLPVALLRVSRGRKKRPEPQDGNNQSHRERCHVDLGKAHGVLHRFMAASISLLRASGWQPSIAWWSDRTPQPGS